MCTMKEVQELHHHTWKTIVAKLGPMLRDFSEPTCIFDVWANGIAGKANGTWCKYNLAYMMTAGRDYFPTVLHEVAHVAPKRTANCSAGS